MADVRQSGTLNQTEFTIAMHYIAKLMDGTLKALPEKLPPAVFQSASSTSSIQPPPQRAQTIDSLGNLAFGQPEWDVTAQEKQQFDGFFNKIDSNQQGYIQGKEAVEFFKNSRLPESELAHVWDLSDIQQRGSLSRDEFAVAMHLIHKRLRGESLPQSLPKSLMPPTKPAFVSSPAFGSPAPAFRSPAPAFAASSPAFASSPAPAFASPAFASPAAVPSRDLLGDFGDDQVSTEINQVNLLQNQISSTSAQVGQLQNQQSTSQNGLEELRRQKQQLESEMSQIKLTHEQAIKDLNELQEQVRREEAEWDQIRGEYNEAQQQLVEIQNESAQVNQKLENGRAETESLRRRIVDVQEETRRATSELERLRGQSKQQTMMLDINQRQVTAAEQDRAEAERHLSDFKTAHNIVDSQPSSVMNTPALDNLFASPVASSPFDEFAQAAATSPSVSLQEPVNDFDAIFGTAPAQWPTSPTKASRGPPPPPPQSRHHRQPSISSVSSGAKKQRAPPPPPPAGTLPVEKKKKDDFEAAFSTTQPADDFEAAFSTTQPADDFEAAFSSNNSLAAPVVVQEDDFEAAFSGNQLPKATIAKDEDFADFDDAFSSFDISAPKEQVKEKAKDEPDWTAAFEPSSKQNDDWDSVFGVAKPSTGFGDSFSSFADDFGKSGGSTPNVEPVAKPVVEKAAPGIVGDKIQDLVKMGFAEQEAKEALNRYDQDLEKASNFLLDQAK